MTTLNDALIAEVLERNFAKSTGTVSSTQLVDGDREQPSLPGALTNKLIRCLTASAQSVFSTMCGIELTVGERVSGKCRQTRFELSGIIGLSGTAKATIVINASTELVFKVAENFLGDLPTEINADVIDIVGELANMIGGNAKERMQDSGLSLGLPTVVAGEDHVVSYGSGITLEYIEFESDAGPLCIEVGMAK